MSYQYQDVPTATTVNEKASKEGNKYGRTYEDTDVLVAKGELQPPEFRDPVFALLFYAQCLAVIVLSLMYATGSIEVDFDDFGSTRRYLRMGDSVRFLKTSSSTSDKLFNVAPLLVGSLSALIVAPIVTVSIFSYMARNAVPLIQYSLYMTIGVNVLLAVLCLLSGSIWGTLATGLGAFFTWMYARYVWQRIPLAAANLKTAITSVQSQLGVAFLGLASIPCYLIWWALWGYFFVCSLNTPFMKSQVESTKIVHASGYKGDDDYVGTLEEQYSGMWWFLVFLMLVSFYWTNQVIRNTIQTTVAGTVGTFWFIPDEAVGCFSPALNTSLFRSLTYSFGSVCMGSLIVAIIQALRAIAQQAEQTARNNNENGGALLLCLAQCLLRMLESIAEYFNKWAFIYVGLYGYPYLQAGHNVLNLFRQRGWTTIISDNLTSRVLGMMSFAIGLATGLIAAILAAAAGILGSGSNVGAMAGGSLILALILGMILASVILSVVNSATDTIIVLFAEAPAEFKQNHPVLAAEMNQAWTNAYPDTFSPGPSAPTMVV